MIDIAKKALQLAMKGEVDQAEAFVTESSSTSIKVYKQEVDELASNTGSGVGIRVIRDGSVGYAYSSDFSDESMADTARAAVENAQVAAKDEFVGLPEPPEGLPSMEIHSPLMSQVPVSDKIGLAMAVEAAALAFDQRISQVEQAAYNEAEATVAIANSLGFEGSYSETTCFTFTMAIALDDAQMQTGISFTTGREPGQLDAEFCGREAAERAVSLLGAGQCRSMTCPVVMDPFVTAGLAGVVGSVLTGESVQKQRSLFAGMEGQRVASPVFRLIDDGTHPEGLASAPFDGEGVPTSRTELIKDGVLQGFLYDTYSGRKDGRPSTGNGIRGSYRGQPHVGSTNLIIGGPVTPRDEILASIDKGFLVTEVSGIHSGANPISGDFSVGAAGHLIEGGSLVAPVREVTIAGNMLSMLDSIEAIGDDHRWVPFGGVVQAPTILLGEMTVSGG